MGVRSFHAVVLSSVNCPALTTVTDCSFDVCLDDPIEARKKVVMPEYLVFLSRKNLDDGGQKTEEVAIAQELYDHLVSLGIDTFLDDVSLIQQGRGRYKQVIDDALDQAEILIAIGTSRENLESEWVRYEWDGFFNDIISGIKPNGQVISLISGLAPIDLPRALDWHIQTKSDHHRRGHC